MTGIEQDAQEIALAGAEKHDADKGSIETSLASGRFFTDAHHSGLEIPTDEDRATLRRVSDSIPWNAYLIAFVELAERFSFYGSQVVFTNFIQQGLPPGSRTGAGGADDTAGALGLGQRASTGLNTFYQFWCYVTPLLGAYIADTYLGRFKTVCYALAVALVGHVILIVSSVPGVIEHPDNAVGCFAVGMIVTGLGTGLFKANISPLVAEQYQRSKAFVATRSDGERVIVDPAYTVSRVYMYFYLFTNIGALIGQISMAYAEKYVGFWLAFTLPTIVFLLCPLVLFYGRNRYIHSPPTGSILATALKLWGFSMKGHWSLNPWKTYKSLASDEFWERAKPSNVPAASRPGWMSFDDVWVDEVKRGVKACGVFVWYPIWWLTYTQMGSNLTSQAAEMETHGVPNDVLSNLDPFALIILIPICDLFLYPALRRVCRFTAIKKIAAGFFTGCMAMIWAAVMQHYIYKRNPCGYYVATCEDENGKGLVANINVWAQTGSYVLIALSEIFAAITGLEYAFTKAPKNMRSLIMALYLFMQAISSAIAEAFVPLSEDPLLVWNYGTMAVIAFVTGILFVIFTRGLDRQEEELNDISEGHVETTVPQIVVPHKHNKEKEDIA
ncbi:oligopeptide transporter [Cylindrobasidium torrendii FP15055 ss-10]|uniref:Oligopeptide transporter n=1 Tax=Cylindrobasidium torrendii FP15055 ss-10 TaxID=1314674 RepID=A0A0D7B6F8_9AGAR|nr:oligopeptide transporter [Cylindrobasidium torrendii FP15055 ss-10]